MAAPPPPPAHAPVDSDDPAVLDLGPCAPAYVELEVRERGGGGGAVLSSLTPSFRIKPLPPPSLFQACLGNHDRDWTRCQAAVKALRECVAKNNQNRAGGDGDDGVTR